MRTIHKYLLTPGPIEVRLQAPEASYVVHVHEQNGLIGVWLMVDTDRPMKPRTFHIVGTGQPLPPAETILNHYGTAHCGEFVWHVVEVMDD